MVKRPDLGDHEVVSVEDVSGSIGLGLVQVQVIAGHKTDASEIATRPEAAPGAAILGSSVAKFQFGDAVQLRFSLGTSVGAVYGIVDAFYLHAHLHRRLRRRGSFDQCKSPCCGDGLLGDVRPRILGEFPLVFLGQGLWIVE